MIRISFSWIAALIIAGTPAFGSAAEKTPLRIGYMPLMNQLPLVISYENDRSDLKTADIKLFKFAAPTALEAALNVGAIDAAYVSILIACKISSRHGTQPGSGVTFIGALHQGGNRLVSAAPGDPESLEGKIIGVPGFRCTENMELRAFMARFGFRYGLDYKTIATPFEAAVKSLKSETLNALYLPEPYGSVAEAEKTAGEMEGTGGRLSKTLSKILVAQSGILVSKREAFNEWLGSIVEACRFIEQDIAETGAGQCAVIQKKYFGFPEQIVKHSLSSRKGGLMFQAHAPDINSLEDIVKLAMEMKLMIEPVNLDSIYDSSYIKEAVNRVKKQ